MKFTHILPLLLLLLGSFIASAQCDKADKLMVKAQKVTSKRPDKAMKFLSKAFDLCPTSEKAAYRIADGAIEQNNYPLLKRTLDRHYEATGMLKQKAWMALASAAFKAYDFDEAIHYYDEFMSRDTMPTKQTMNARLGRASAIYARDAYRHQEVVEFHGFPAGVNTESSEYLAVMPASEDQLIFTRRTRGVETAMQADATLDYIRPAFDQLDRFTTAATTISPDGQYIALAIGNHPHGLGNFDLFYMKWVDNRWEGPFSFGREINTPGWESQPCFSPDGHTLYFASDRKGGHGGKDIWRAKQLSDGSWDRPQNLGPMINTRWDEENPYLHRDQRHLYFRSNGHPGLGSFDIFVSEKVWAKGWDQPSNLGYPINSMGNDGSFFLKNDGKTAFIASNVDRTQHYPRNDQKMAPEIDLYRFELPEHIAPAPVHVIRLQSISSKHLTPIQANVFLLQADRMDTLFAGPTNAAGEWMLVVPQDTAYSLHIVADNHLPYFERYHADVQQTTADSIHTITLQAIPSADTVGDVVPIVLENVLFESGSAELLPSSEVEIDQLASFLKSNPGVRIEIHGHTDNIGRPDENLTLSEARATAVLTSLVEHDVDRHRLTAHGFGDTQPIADNDTAAGRQLNRRTEFVVVR